jgi:tRNA dimethylallyltransferase
MPKIPPIFILGATAAGKSAVALRVAETIRGEIISVDSMQVYRGLDVGTAKPTAQERTRIPHHLVDVADLQEPFDAARFLQLARRAAEQIESRGNVPVFCGGTGLYFKAYLEGIGQGPPADAMLRAELEAIPLASLLAELERADPALFARIDRANRRRVIRAIEVTRLTGRPFSEQRATWARSVPTMTETDAGVAVPEPGLLLVGLRRAPEDLRQRIDRRVDAMFQEGLVAETERLLTRGLRRNPTALQAIGYRQVAEHLAGLRSLSETVSLIKQKTRQLAKRQMTWFKHQLPAQWLDLESDTPAQHVAQEIARMAVAGQTRNSILVPVRETTLPKS